jgi:twitching motility two-component system response regulator PilG
MQPNPVPIFPLVMVVDESLFYHRWMKVILGREGFSVISYAESFEALRALVAPDAPGRPAMAFVEMDFPRSRIKSGLTLIRIITSNEALKDFPIVVVTRRDRIFDRLQARLAGAKDYLIKPLTTQKVIAAARQYTHQP